MSREIWQKDFNPGRQHDAQLTYYYYVHFRQEHKTSYVP